MTCCHTVHTCTKEFFKFTCFLHTNAHLYRDQCVTEGSLEEISNFLFRQMRHIVVTCVIQSRENGTERPREMMSRSFCWTLEALRFGRKKMKKNRPGNFLFTDKAKNAAV